MKNSDNQEMILRKNREEQEQNKTNNSNYKETTKKHMDHFKYPLIFIRYNKQ